MDAIKTPIIRVHQLMTSFINIKQVFLPPRALCVSWIDRLTENAGLILGSSQISDNDRDTHKNVVRFKTKFQKSFHYFYLGTENLIHFVSPTKF